MGADVHGLIQSARAARSAIPVVPVDSGSLARVARELGDGAAAWIRASAFRAVPGRTCLLPDASGKVRAVLVGVASADDVFALATLPPSLPEGDYRLSTGGLAVDPLRAALGWGLGAYRFVRYRKPARNPARLVVDRATLHAVTPRLDAVVQVRDLINTPTEDLGPAELAMVIRNLARAHRASYREFVGAQLLRANFPAIHAVGRASHRAPRLVELNWGRARDPRLVLVGKGVCFDTGGLDIKSEDGMRWMKKDMGGAAQAIALAGLVMQTRLPVRLTLLVPAVENAIAANAYRPGEVIRTRAGISVEVDNTDAEGRLILCDALAYAVERKPDLVIDIATLTGAAKVALGPDLPALFANHDPLADALLEAGRREQDPLWRLPLWAPYRSMLESRVADMVNCSPSRFGGAITAALFLQRFVPETTAWMHLDAYSWNDTDRPGRPQGGEAQGLRALFAVLNERYAARRDGARRRS
jgi:leucyl aminopeptidase